MRKFFFKVYSFNLSISFIHKFGFDSTYLSFGLGTSSQVSFFLIWLNSSSIALIQCLSLLASSKSLGSTIDSKDKCTCFGVCTCFLLLVSTPMLLSPIICFGGWFLWTHRLGVFKGVWGTCWLLPSSDSSSSYCSSSWFSSSSCSSEPSFLTGDKIDSSVFPLMLSTTLPSLRL